MLALASVTQPGPFGPRTIELGEYWGVRRRGVLVAMAGERMRLDGFTEISSVCVDAAQRGQGFAADLVRSLVASIVARSEIPFLHAFTSNHPAIVLYRKLGFALRRRMHLAVLGRAEAGLSPDTPNPSKADAAVDHRRLSEALRPHSPRKSTRSTISAWRCRSSPRRATRLSRPAYAQNFLTWSVARRCARTIATSWAHLAVALSLMLGRNAGRCNRCRADCATGAHDVPNFKLKRYRPGVEPQDKRAALRRLKS
jgi:hypothetical protein